VFGFLGPNGAGVVVPLATAAALPVVALVLFERRDIRA
jgi:hypothetical protein